MGVKCTFWDRRAAAPSKGKLGSASASPASAEAARCGLRCMGYRECPVCHPRSRSDRNTTCMGTQSLLGKAATMRERDALLILRLPEARVVAYVPPHDLAMEKDKFRRKGNGHRGYRWQPKSQGFNGLGQRKMQPCGADSLRARMDEARQVVEGARSRGSTVLQADKAASHLWPSEGSQGRTPPPHGTLSILKRLQWPWHVPMCQPTLLTHLSPLFLLILPPSTPPTSELLVHAAQPLTKSIFDQILCQFVTLSVQ